MSLVYAAQLAWIHRVLVAVLVVAGTALAVASLTLGGEWRATASVLVRADGPDGAGQYVNQPERFIRSEARVVEGDDVLDRAASEVPGTTVTGLRDAVTVSGGSVDDVLDVAVVAGAEADAAQRLDAVVAAYLDTTEARARLLETRSPWRSPARTNRLALGAGGGLAAGVLAALVLGAIRRPVTGPEQVADLVDGDADVYPYELRRRAGRNGVARPRGFAELAGWLGTRAGGPGDVVVTVPGGGDVPSGFVDGLEDAAPGRVRPGPVAVVAGPDAGPDAAPAPVAGRRVRPDQAVLLVERGRTGERAVEKHLRAHAAGDRRTAVVVVARSAARSARRGGWR